jgi:hypothetical protein
MTEPAMCPHSWAAAEVGDDVTVAFFLDHNTQANALVGIGMANRSGPCRNDVQARARIWGLDAGEALAVFDCKVARLTKGGQLVLACGLRFGTYSHAGPGPIIGTLVCLKREGPPPIRLALRRHEPKHAHVLADLLEGLGELASAMTVREAARP